MRLLRTIISIGLFSLLTACGGGGGSSDTPTDPATIFDVSRYSYANISEGTIYSYTLNGTVTYLGNTYTASASQSAVNTGATTYLSDTVYQRTTLTKISFQVNQQTYSQTDNSYVYTDGLGNIVYFSDGSTLIQQTITPDTAVIGDSGHALTLTTIDGEKLTVTWSLKDGYNGKGILQIDYAYTDLSNNLVASEVDKYTIDPSGNIEYITVTGFNSDISFSFSGS